jgi:hypothetical protein
MKDYNMFSKRTGKVHFKRTETECMLTCLDLFEYFRHAGSCVFNAKSYVIHAHHTGYPLHDTSASVDSGGRAKSRRTVTVNFASLLCCLENPICLLRISMH